jgi:hypothetical protein
MLKKIVPVLFLFVTFAAWACPGCDSAAGKAGQPPWTLYILGGFVLLIYIPFFILFRAAKKYDPKNLVDGHE